MNETKCPFGHQMFFVQKLSAVANYYWCTECHAGYTIGVDEKNADAP
jgi:hypothetical protein